MDDSNTLPPRTEERPSCYPASIADLDPRRPQRDKLAAVCALHVERTGRRGNFLLTSQIDSEQCRKEGTWRDLGLVAVEPASFILPGIYYVGEIAMQQTAEAPARTVFADDEHRPEDYQEAEEPILSQTQRDSDDEANAAKAAAAAALQADKRRTAQLVRRIFWWTFDQLRDDYNMEELAALATTAKRVNAECAGVVKEMHDELAAPIKEARKG